MVQSGLRQIACIGTVAVDDAGIPRSPRIHGLVAGFLPPAVPVNDRVRPRFAVPEPGHVVISKHAKDGHTKTNRRQLLNAGSGHLFGVLKAQPAEMGSMNELGHAGFDGSHHRLWAHGVYLDPDAGFL